MAGQFYPSPNSSGSSSVSFNVLSNIGGGAFGGSYQPTVLGKTSNPTKGTTQIYDYGAYRRVGDCCEILYNYEQLNAGSAGSGAYLWSLPGTLIIDTTKMPIHAGPGTSFTYYGQGVLGLFSSCNVLSNIMSVGYLAAYSTTQLIAMTGATQQPLVELGSAFHGYGNTQLRHSFNARFPVVGWSSTDA